MMRFLLDPRFYVWGGFTLNVGCWLVASFLGQSSPIILVPMALGIVMIAIPLFVGLIDG